MGRLGSLWDGEGELRKVGSMCRAGLVGDMDDGTEKGAVRLLSSCAHADCKAIGTGTPHHGHHTHTYTWVLDTNTR